MATSKTLFTSSAPPFETIFDTGGNDGRNDLTHILSLKIDYPLSDSFKISAFTGFTSRDSSTGQDNVNYDYESYDAGASLGLTARF